MTRAERYDAIVIGTGQGGKPLAAAFAGAGWKTAIVEREHVGGSCVNVGCTPTKTMVASARVAHLVRRAPDYGVHAPDPTVDQKMVRRRKRAIVESFRAGSTRGLQRHEALDLVMGEASFIGPRQLHVDLRDGGSRTLVSERIFINTGARPAVPGIPGLQDVDYLDSTSIMELEEVPEHLIVLGGGYVGLEFGQMFRRFGGRVTIVELARRLLPTDDPDVSEAVASILIDEGIDVRVGTTAVRVEGGEGVVRLSLESAEESGTIQGSHLLLAVGRTPNSHSLKLEAAGVQTDAMGFIPVNERLETNVPGIWALGDVNGGPAFTHISYDDYRIIRSNLLEGGNASTVGRLVPYTVYIDPQVAGVGLRADEARAQGLDIRVAKMPMSHVARALEVDEARGFMKAVVEADSGRILGFSIVGIEGGEIMSMVQLAMMGGLPYTALRDAVFSHPTLAESLNNLFASLAA
ncbi:MAG: mercuric reductase [Gemmatimonadota bacterium]